MEIILNKRAIVRCSDGKCYPCIALSQITDPYNIHASIYIEFINLRPDDVIVKRITVPSFRVTFEEQGKKE